MRGVLITVAVATGFLAAPAAAAPVNPIQAENSRQGDFFWTVTTAPEGAIEGYFSETSAAPGDTVHLHVNVPTGDHYRIEVHRLGWYGGSGGRRVLCLPSCTSDEAGIVQPPPPSPDLVTGEVAANWPVTDSFLVGGDWVSGYYVAELRLTTGPVAGTSRRAPLIVREAEPEGTVPSTFLVQVPLNTWQAYNSWGGKSLYGYNSTEGQSAKRVSFDRPYNLFAQNLFMWEYQLVRYLEREGEDVSYATDLDVHRDPGLLLEHRAVLVAGHDEYWTREMRDGFDSARDHGTNLAFMGGDTAFWQMRYADGGRTIEEYRTTDADPEPDPALKTIRFRELGRPECELLGVEYQGGQRVDGDPPRDYALDDSALMHPWMEGTGFQAGDVLSDLVGYEWDRIVPACAPAPVTRFFHYEGLPSDADAVAYVAPSGARVFAAGSVQFSWALDDYEGHAAPPDVRVQRFVRNILADMARPAPATGVMPEVSGNSVHLVFDLPDDPRTEAQVSRITADDTEIATLVCTTRGSPCEDAPPSGTYRYSVKMVDGWNESSQIYSDPVEVLNAPPVASIHLSSGEVITRERTTLSGAASNDPDGEIVSYAWDLDADGEFDDAFGPEAEVAFSDPGKHPVRLRVTDTNGDDATAEALVTAYANARVQGSTLVYEAAPREENSITISETAQGFLVADGVGTIGAGDGCTGTLDGDAVCEDSVTTVLILAGDGDDGVTLGAAVPAKVFGGPGDDVLSGSFGADSLRGEEGNDVLSGKDGGDDLRGGSGSDHVSGGSGNDVLVEDASSNGADLLAGGPGSDTVSYAERTAPVSVTIGLLADDGEVGEGDDIGANIERLMGGSGPDRLVGTAHSETLIGAAGDDELVGHRGRDLLLGGRGSDVLRPGIDRRSDRVRGGDGIDRGRAEPIDRTYSVEYLQLVR
jgi:hypothetical protein